MSCCGRQLASIFLPPTPMFRPSSHEARSGRHPWSHPTSWSGRCPLCSNPLLVASPAWVTPTPSERQAIGIATYRRSSAAQAGGGEGPILRGQTKYHAPSLEIVYNPEVGGVNMTRIANTRRGWLIVWARKLKSSAEVLWIIQVFNRHQEQLLMNHLLDIDSSITHICDEALDEPMLPLVYEG